AQMTSVCVNRSAIARASGERPAKVPKVPMVGEGDAIVSPGRSIPQAHYGRSRRASTPLALPALALARFHSRPMVAHMKTAFITGASTVIGHASAIHLSKNGFLVFAGVRKTSDAERLTKEGGDNVVPIPIDVTDEESIRAALALARPRLAA